MFIRRKVFSLLQDQNGQEKYFSTTDFELSEDGYGIEKIFAEHGEDNGFAAMNVEKGEAIGLADDEAEGGLEGREEKDALLLDPSRWEKDGLAEAVGREQSIPLRTKTLGSDAGRPNGNYYKDHNHNDDPRDEHEVEHLYSDKDDHKPSDWDEEDELHFKNLEERRERLKRLSKYGKYATAAMGGIMGSSAGIDYDRNTYNKKHGIIGALAGAGIGYGLGHLAKKVSDHATNKETDRQKDEYRSVSDKNARRMRGLELRMKNDRKDNPNVVYVY